MTETNISFSGYSQKLICDNKRSAEVGRVILVVQPGTFSIFLLTLGNIEKNGSSGSLMFKTSYSKMFLKMKLICRVTK